MNRISLVLILLYAVTLSSSQGKTWSTIDEASNVDLDCSRFKRDQDVLRSFGYPVQLNPLITTDKTYAIMNQASQVEELQVYRENRLPLDVFCLVNLQILRVNGTPFEIHKQFEDEYTRTALSPLISRLTRLRILSLSNTNASHIPSQSLAVLTNLTVLEIDNCGLREIPIAISSLVNLQQIRLPRNHLHSLPQDTALRRFLKLTLIDFSHNKIKDIMDIADIPSRSIASMDFSYNEIDYIPPEIGQFFYNLLYLYFNNNKLNYIPTDVFRLTYLKKVDLQQNPFPLDEITAIKTRFKNSIPNTQLQI